MGYVSQMGSLPTIDDPTNPSLITVPLDSSISGGVYTFDVTYTVTNTVDGSSVSGTQTLTVQVIDDCVVQSLSCDSALIHDFTQVGSFVVAPTF